MPSVIYQNLYSGLRESPNPCLVVDEACPSCTSAMAEGRPGTIGTAPPSMLGGGRQRHDGELRTGRPLHGFVVDSPRPDLPWEEGCWGYRREGAATGPPARSTQWRSPSVTRWRSTPQGA
jgi:hypothetical protein